MVHSRQRHPHKTASRRSRHRDLHHNSRGRSVWVLLVLLLLWSVCLGVGLAQAKEPRPLLSLAPLTAQPNADRLDADTPLSGEAIAAVAETDPVPDRLQLGQELYLQNCASCHIGVPAGVLPVQTWRQLLRDPQHYGTQIKPLLDTELLIVWEYLRYYSRPLAEEEPVPFRISQSRYFKALHPRVKFEQRVNLAGCISCHPGADKYDFRRLSAEWQNAP